MPILTKYSMPCRMNRRPLPPQAHGGREKYLLFLLLAAAMTLTACGGSSSCVATVPLTLSGNWQFTMQQQTDGNPSDPAFQGGLQGGFLSQTTGTTSGTATGTAAYSVASSTSTTGPCNAGSAGVTGSITGQNVTLTAVAGTDTFSLTGTLSLDRMSMGGTYTSVAGPLPDGSTCGYSESTSIGPLPQWYATLVPPLTGPIQGSFHSSDVAAPLLYEQDFLVSGGLSQGESTGASAPVTGSLNFVNPATTLSDYPCLTSTAAITGTISGSSVVLQIVGTGGSILGKIGDPAAGLSPVTLGSAQGGYILQGIAPSYSVGTAAGTPCPGDPGSTKTAGDYGNICLALGSSNACQQPITLTPSALTFASQAVSSSPTTQPITLTNTTSSALGGLILRLAETDQSGTVSFTETDNCGPNGTLAGTNNPFSLGGPGNPPSCIVTISFSPQLTCTGTPDCLTATLSVNSPSNDTIYTVPIVGTGTGPGGSAASTHPHDFDKERVSQVHLLQLLAFTNQHPVQSLCGSSQSHFQDVEHHAEID